MSQQFIEHDGDIAAQKDEDGSLILLRVGYDDAEDVLIGRIDFDTLKVLYVAEGYEDVVESRIAPLRNMKDAMGL